MIALVKTLQPYKTLQKPYIRGSSIILYNHIICKVVRYIHDIHMKEHGFDLSWGVYVKNDLTTLQEVGNTVEYGIFEHLKCILVKPYILAPSANHGKTCFRIFIKNLTFKSAHTKSVIFGGEQYYF